MLARLERVASGFEPVTGCGQKGGSAFLLLQKEATGGLSEATHVIMGCDRQAP